MKCIDVSLYKALGTIYIYAKMHNLGIGHVNVTKQSFGMDVESSWLGSSFLLSAVRNEFNDVFHLCQEFNVEY